VERFQKSALRKQMASSGWGFKERTQICPVTCMSLPKSCVCPHQPAPSLCPLSPISPSVSSRGAVAVPFLLLRGSGVQTSTSPKLLSGFISPGVAGVGLEATLRLDVQQGLRRGNSRDVPSEECHQKC
jgi:hypothetical protein